MIKARKGVETRPDPSETSRTAQPTGDAEERIRVFVASRQDDQFDGQPLTVFRQALKERLDKATMLGHPIFRTVLSEAGSPGGQGEEWWTWSQNEVRRADVVLVLYNGSAGTVPPHPARGSAGICHAEYALARSERPTAHIVLRLAPPGNYRPSRNQKILDRRYQEELDASGAQTGALIATIAQLNARIDTALHAFVLSRLREGMSTSASQFDRGPALVWASKRFEDRREVMREVLTQKFDYLKTGLASRPMVGETVLLVCDAIPGSMSVPAAREMVGQPFVGDHRYVVEMTARNLVGPVHVIACHRGVTEAQALRVLGFADATVVKKKWGVLVADELHKVQMMFLTDCRDEFATRLRVDQAFAWLADVGQEQHIARRAVARRRIVEAIAAEQSAAAVPSA